METKASAILGAGVAGIVGTVVLACKATLNAEQVIDNHHKRLQMINEAIEAVQNGEVDAEVAVTYDEKAIQRDKLIAYCKTIGEFTKLYAPSVIIGTISIGLILTSHGIMKRRYLGVVAAYNLLSESFRQYRDRVIADGGNDLDRKYMYGFEKEEIVEQVTDEKGKTKNVKETVETSDGKICSPYARWYMQGVPSWNKSLELNRMFLQSQEKIFNNILQTRGHVFLNEVYDALGFKQTPEGAVTGWLKDGKDGYVDFNIYAPDNRMFVNGEDNAILLDFNVDGVILDGIPRRNALDMSL